MRKSQLSTLIPSLILGLLIVSSCNDKQLDAKLGSTILDTISSDKILQGNNRAFEEVTDETQKVTFTVIYNGDLDNLVNNANGEFKALVDAYGLRMESSFEIDEENKAIVLVPFAKLAAPIQVGKELSLINEVLMIEVGGVNNEKSTELTS